MVGLPVETRGRTRGVYRDRTLMPTPNPFATLTWEPHRYRAIVYGLAYSVTFW